MSFIWYKTRGSKDVYRRENRPKKKGVFPNLFFRLFSLKQDV